jgi:hypothetical protein
MTAPARFISRAYARLLSGQAASSVGDAVFTVSAVLWVDPDLAAGRPWAAAAVSGVTAAAYGAVAIAGPAAGVVVDRFDRRSVMAAAELARAGLAAVPLWPRCPVPNGSGDTPKEVTAMPGKLYRICPGCGCARFHIPSGRCSQCGYTKPKPKPRKSR